MTWYVLRYETSTSKQQCVIGGDCIVLNFLQTTEEFRQLMNGYIHKKSGRKYRGSQFLEPNFLEAPRSVDWREKGYVTPVKDQVFCDGQFLTSFLSAAFISLQEKCF